LLITGQMEVYWSSVSPPPPESILRMSDSHSGQVQFSYPGDWVQLAGGYVSRPASFQIRLYGDASRYPFDTYRSSLAARLFVGSESTPPAATEVQRRFSGFTVSYERGFTGFGLVLERPVFERILFIAAAVVLGTQLAIVLTASFLTPARGLLPIMLAAASQAFATASIQRLVVAPDINTRTLFDTALLLPFLAGSILALGVGVWRYYSEVMAASTVQQPAPNGESATDEGK
jgi:hypothetical protein